MTGGRILAVTVPKWGMAMEEGTVTAWHVEEGAPVAEGDEVLDVESTKIANAIEARAGGVLRRRVAAVGATLPVGGLLAVIGGGGRERRGDRRLRLRLRRRGRPRTTRARAGRRRGSPTPADVASATSRTAREANPSFWSTASAAT